MNHSSSFSSRTYFWLPLLFFCLLGSVRAETTPALERVVFRPGWFASAQFAGVFTALDRGYYREVGLAVEVALFAYGQNSAAAIDAEPEVCALGTIEGYILLQKRSDGTDLKALAAMLQESPAGYMSLAPTKIARVRDFGGHRVGVHKFADRLYAWFIQQAGLAPADVRMIFVEDDVTLLTRGELDIMQGYATEEFVRLQALTGNQGRFISFASLGFPSYSEILYTTAKQSERHAPALKKFIAATRRGWTYAFAHPAEAVASVRARSGPDADQAHLPAAFAALESYVCPGGQPPLGAMDPVKWQKVQHVGIEIGLLRQAEPVADFLLNW